MNINRNLHRRAVLRGAGGALIALPWLEALQPRRARAALGEAGEAPYPRFVVFYTPNGHPAPHFRAPGADPFAAPILRPLLPHRERLLVLENIALRSAERVGHECIGSLLTGTRPGAGRSLDQEIAALLPPTRLGSLQLGVSVPAAPASRVHLSFSVANRPRPAVSDPRAVFDQLFPGDGSGPPTALRLAQRKSVLDGIKSNLEQTIAQVSGADRQVLLGHLESLREVELGLGRQLPAACMRPERPPMLEVTAHDQAMAIAGLQGDLLALAFACDSARVATLMLGEAGSERTFPFLGAAPDRPGSSWVGLSHQTDAAGQQGHRIISTWCAERLSALVTRLASMPEGDGTALDRTVILWATECNPDHTVNNLPLLLVLGSRLPVRGGRVKSFGSNTSHNDLLLALLALTAGARPTSFGNPAFCNGPLVLA